MSDDEWIDSESPLSPIETAAKVIGYGFVYGAAVLLALIAAVAPPSITTAIGYHVVSDMAIDGTSSGAVFVFLFTVAGLCFDLGIMIAADELDV